MVKNKGVFLLQINFGVLKVLFQFQESLEAILELVLSSLVCTNQLHLAFEIRLTLRLHLKQHSQVQTRTNSGNLEIGDSCSKPSQQNVFCLAETTDCFSLIPLPLTKIDYYNQAKKHIWRSKQKLKEAPEIFKPTISKTIFDHV